MLAPRLNRVTGRRDEASRVSTTLSGLAAPSSVLVAKWLVLKSMPLLNLVERGSFLLEVQKESGRLRVVDLYLSYPN
jgi:hypothetical protein